MVLEGHQSTRKESVPVKMVIKYYKRERDEVRRINVQLTLRLIEMDY